MKNGGGQNGARSGCIRLQEPSVVSFDLVCLFPDLITPPQLTVGETVGHNLPRVCCLWARMAEQEGRPVPWFRPCVPFFCRLDLWAPTSRNERIVHSYRGPRGAPTTSSQLIGPCDDYLLPRAPLPPSQGGHTRAW
jgi:hypothetical protein